jgi:hypothetical protein
VCGVLDLTRYPEAAAAALKSETEAARLQPFRRRCLQASAAACALVLLFWLRRR